jgi:MoaA/NifB/PqqE/SkfB family radical SAM enzyme
MKSLFTRTRYNAWLVWNPTDACNLQCLYCFRFQKGSKVSAEDAKTAHAIDIPVLLKTLNATGKIFRITFSGGGEPFLIPNLIEACTALTKKHYLSFNTNLVSPAIKELVANVKPHRIINIHASLHMKELERHNLLDRYIANFLLCKSKNIAIHPLAVAHPTLVDEVPSYRKFFLAKGINIKFSTFIGEHDGKQYPAAYTERENKVFGFSTPASGKKPFSQKGTWCNAGYNAGVVSPSGGVQPCHYSPEIIGNIYKAIHFSNTLTKCPVEFCGCPLKHYDPRLFDEALQKVNPNK